MYKITGIYNRDKLRTPRTDGRYPLRIGRCVSDKTILFATVGSPLVLLTCFFTYNKYAKNPANV